MTTTRSVFIASFICGLAAMGTGASAQSLRIERISPRVREAWAQRFQEARLGPEQSERFTKTIKAGRGATLDVQNISGAITVTGATGDDIVIDAVKRVRARDEARAKAILADIEIRLIDRPGRVTVRTMYPRMMNNVSAAVDYTVRVPVDASVDLSNVSGDLRVTNVKGELRLESVNGNVHAGQAPKLGFARSVSGNVEITGQIDGDLSASSLTGALMLRDVKARGIELTTISGDVVLNDVLVDRVRVRSVNGDLQFVGPLSKNGRYDMNSHSGRIRMVISQIPGFELDASTFSGNVRSDLPLIVTSNRSERPGAPPPPPPPPTPPRPPDDRRRGVREQTVIRGLPRVQVMRGTFGDASAYIVVHTFSGDIVIEKSEKKP